MERKIGLGLVLVLAGGLLLMRNLGLLPYEIVDAVFNWSVLIMLIGVISMLSKKNKTGGVIIFSVGAYFWVDRFLNLNLDWAKTFWPVLIIIIGAYILVKHSQGNSSMRFQKKKNELDPESDSKEDINGDYLDEMTIFGGSEKSISSQAFKGGKITTIFGGMKLNLGRAQLVNDHPAEIEIFCLFGGIEIIVPKDWQVNSDVSPILGGFEDSRIMGLSPTDPRKTIKIKGLIMFGGGEIKSI